MTSVESVIIAGTAVGIVAMWWYCVGIVGRVAEGFGEDPARWQRLMLPFGVFGPVLAWLLLSRRGGGGAGGRYA